MTLALQYENFAAVIIDEDRIDSFVVAHAVTARAAVRLLTPGTPSRTNERMRCRASRRDDSPASLSPRRAEFECQLVALRPPQSLIIGTVAFQLDLWVWFRVDTLTTT